MILQVLLVFVVSSFVSGSPVSDVYQDRSARIVGGQDAPQGRFPWAVGLRNTGGGHFCGGSIVNNRWVLSAAHCTLNRAPANTRALVGTINRDGTGGVNHEVTRIINHPSYNSQTLDNDISLLQTTNVIVFNTNTRSIEMGSSFIGGGVNVIAIGFGSLGPGLGMPPQLQWVTLTTTAECERQDILCTRVPAGRGTCFGDSGSSLTSAGFQVGIASWIRGECGDGRIDGFTRVSSYRTWILNNAR